jgi:hypothetical protein
MHDFVGQFPVLAAFSEWTEKQRNASTCILSKERVTSRPLLRIMLEDRVTTISKFLCESPLHRRKELSTSNDLGHDGECNVLSLRPNGLQTCVNFRFLSSPLEAWQDEFAVTAQLFRQMQLFLEVLNEVLEFRQIFRRRFDQGLVSFQHRLCPSGAVFFFQRYWKSLPVLSYGAHTNV